MSLRTKALVAALLASLAACGDDDPIAIEDIPDEALLVELSSAEFDGVCEWAKGVAREKLPADTNCQGVPINYSGCMHPPAECTATVGQWKVCMPAFIDRIAQDPCVVLSLAQSPTGLAGFVEGTPGCAMLGPCATAMGM